MSQLTKKAIVNTFIEMLNERPLDKITVKDIVEACGITRNTFYYHFQDLYALLEYVFEMETSRVVEEHKQYMNWQEGFIESASFALENKKAIYHVYNSVNREQLERYLLGVTESLMIEFVRRQAEGLDVAEDDLKLIGAFYKHALVGLVLEWLSDGMKQDPEDVIRRLGFLLGGNIRYSLMKISAKG